MYVPRQSHVDLVLKRKYLNCPLYQIIALATVFHILNHRVVNTYLGVFVCSFATPNTDCA